MHLMTTRNKETERLLFSGYYHCDRCGRTDAPSIVRYKGRRVCPDCIDIIPSADPVRGGDGEVRTDTERAEVEAFWGWYWESQKARPPRYTPPYRKAGPPEVTPDDLYPLCACGQPREANRIGNRAGGLFGGPFMRECPVCRARHEVEQVVASTTWLHPEWDDEEWLDLLYRSHRRAFELGVLPDYWYELRRAPAPPESEPASRPGRSYTTQAA